MNKKKRIITALVGIIIGLTLVTFHKQNILTLEQLNLNKHALMNFVHEHYIFSALLFIVSYIIFAALMLPGAFILSLAGGLLFGVLPGAIYVTIGATVGAYCAFLATRYFFGNTMQKKYHKALDRFNTALTENGPAYLFIVRLIPIFPFFFVNLLAGLSNVSPKHFIITTAIGILPLVLGFTFLGAQLRSTETVHDFFSYPLTVAGLLLLSLLTLHSIAKKWRRN